MIPQRCSIEKDLLPTKFGDSLGHNFIWTNSDQAAKHLWLVTLATCINCHWVIHYQVREKERDMRMNNPQREPFSEKGLTSSISATTSSRAFFFREANLSRVWQFSNSRMKLITKWSGSVIFPSSQHRILYMKSSKHLKGSFPPVLIQTSPLPGHKWMQLYQTGDEIPAKLETSNQHH